MTVSDLLKKFVNDKTKWDLDESNNPHLFTYVQDGREILGCRLEMMRILGDPENRDTMESVLPLEVSKEFLTPDQVNARKTK